MTDLFPIEDYKRVPYPEIEPLNFSYFCVGFYISGKRWRIFPEAWLSPDNPDFQKFIAEKKSTGWIMFVCKLPDFKSEVKHGD